ITSEALKAWNDCLSKKAGQLYSTVETVEDSNRFTIRVHFRPQAGGNLVLRDYPANAGFSCKLGDRDIRDLTPANLGYGDTFFINCERTSKGEESIQVHINTNLADDSTIGPFTLPSRYYLTVSSEVDTLRQRLVSLAEELNSRLSSLDRQIVAERVD